MDQGSTKYYRFEAAVHKVHNKPCYFLADVHLIRAIEVYLVFYRQVLTGDNRLQSCLFPCGDTPHVGEGTVAKTLSLTNVGKAVSKTFRRAGVVTPYPMGVRRIRESVVTFSRTANLPRDQQAHLAEAMSHDLKTADRFYDVGSAIASAKMVTIMETLTKKAASLEGGGQETTVDLS